MERVHDDVAPAEERESGPKARGSGAGVLAATILGSSMAFVDSAAVSVALPVLQTDLEATAAAAQWVVEINGLFLAALLLVGGALGDRLGRRRVFAVGALLFGLASGWAGLAQTTGQLILARAVGGIGGALLVPGSLAIINAAFTRERLGRAIGTWTAATSIISAMGTVLGGWLTGGISWRAVFGINVPLAAITLALTFVWVQESRSEDAAGRIDLKGAALAIVALGALVYGLIESPVRGLGDPLIVAGFIVGLLALGAFLWREARAPWPMLPLGLFRVRAFAGTNVLTFFLYAALWGVTFYLPFNLIQVQGYSALAAGAATVPFVLVIFLLSRWSGALVDRFGPRMPLMVGPLVAALGFALFALPGIGGSYWTTFFPANVVLGVGMALSITPLTTTVMGSVPVQRSGIASAINNAVSRIGGLLAIAVMGVLLTQVFGAALDRRLEDLNLPPEAAQVVEAQRGLLAGAQLPDSFDESLRVTVERAIDEAYVQGFRWVSLLGATLAVAAAASSALTIRADRPHPPGAEA
ncbi:MAG: MFS transporter [Anaerolineae bacterium]